MAKTAQGGEYVENTFSVTLAKKSEYTSSSDGSSDSSGSQSQDQGNNQPNRKAKADTGTQYGWKAVSHLKAIGCD